MEASQRSTRYIGLSEAVVYAILVSPSAHNLDISSTPHLTLGAVVVSKSSDSLLLKDNHLSVHLFQILDMSYICTDEYEGSNIYLRFVEHHCGSHIQIYL